MKELHMLSACEAVAQLERGTVTIGQLLDCLRARIEIVEPVVNALPTLCFERAYEQAELLQSRPSEQRGRLRGLPVTIKDLTPVAGVRTTFGSLVFKDFIPPTSDQLVSRIERDGGVVYAKSNTPEFGVGGITFNEVFESTRSPHNTAFASGGSSGGAAASLAAGCAWLSHGSDMAGSLRTPAAFCGVTSLRPSPGTIRADAPYLPFQVLGENGPMARNLADLALFADVMRDDVRDTLQDSVYQAGLHERPLQGVKIASSTDLGITEVESEISGAFSQFERFLASQAESLTNCQPDLSGVHEAFDVLRAEIFAVGLEELIEAHQTVIKPEVLWNVQQGLQLSSAQKRQALRLQGQIVNRAAAFMQEYDVLICPATSCGSVEYGLRYPGENTGVAIPEYYRWLAIAYATTMTALPVITLPVATLANGMPFAVQLVGKPYGERALFRIARQLEILVDRNTDPVDP